MASVGSICRYIVSLLAAFILLGSHARVLAESVEFSLISYNTYLRSPVWLFRDDHDQRANFIPQYLTGFDVIVLQEAFSDRHRQDILQALASEYPHQSKSLGDNEFLSHNGGVVLASRWPILNERQLIFTDCRWPDCMVKKGAIYLEIDRNGKPIHIVGLHMQAERAFSDTRRKQLLQLRSYLDELDIPDNELLLIAGDFNIDYLTRSHDGEFDFMLSTLGAGTVNDDFLPSYDSASNTVLSGTYTERLDYILAGQHQPPVLTGSTRVIPVRHADADLSDHHAVAGRFIWASD